MVFALCLYRVTALFLSTKRFIGNSVLQLNEQSKAGRPVWELAFRSFFLAAAGFAVFAMGLWYSLLAGWLNTQPVVNSMVWHAHEMLFGFSALVVAGFLLTAVQTWTGLNSLSGKPLVCLLGFWLLSRVSFWLDVLPADLAIFLVLISSLLWWLAVIVTFSRLVWRSNNRRNYQFVFMLCSLMLLQQTALYISWQGNAGLALHLLDVAVLVFVFVINQLGARVIPFFTQNALQIRYSSTDKIDKSLSVLFCFLIALFLFAYWFDVSLYLTFLLLLTAGIHFWRSVIWFKPALLQQPLLWSLHLSYVFISLGLLVLGLSYYLDEMTKSQALHVLTIGAIGGAILAMIARVSLGHTGRPLKLKPLMKYALCCVFVAAITRFLLILLGFGASIAWAVSTAFWCFAFIVFIFSYWKILIQPRYS